MSRDTLIAGLEDAPLVEHGSRHRLTDEGGRLGTALEPLPAWAATWAD